MNAADGVWCDGRLQEELAALVKEIDNDGNGGIDFGEFMTMIKGAPSAGGGGMVGTLVER